MIKNTGPLENINGLTLYAKLIVPGICKVKVGLFKTPIKRQSIKLKLSQACHVTGGETRQSG